MWKLVVVGLACLVGRSAQADRGEAEPAADTRAAPGYRHIVVPGLVLWPPGVKVRLQQRLGDHASLVVGGGIANASWSAQADGDAAGVGWARWQAIGGLDLHPQGKGLHGMYLGPRVLYAHGTGGLCAETFAAGRDVLVVRGVVGYRVIVDPGAALALGLGGAWRTAVTRWSTEEQAASSEIRVLVPTVEAQVGWAF